MPSLIYYGASGSGKTESALKYAKSLLGKAQHNLVQYFPDGKTGMHAMSSMRACIQEAITRPFEGDAKVILIHGADRMLPSSSNALLKTLEEPLESTTLILITDQLDRLLPTIRSRCILTPFIGEEKAEVPEISDLLKLKESDPYLFAQKTDRYLESLLRQYKTVPGIEEWIEEIREGLAHNLRLDHAIEVFKLRIQQLSDSK